MDNDLISRAAALNALLMSKNYRDAHDALEQLPAIDAMPVVRCKNCKYWEPDQAPLDEIVDNHPCQYYNVWRAPDDYCSCGEAIDDTPTCGSDYCEIGGD